MSWLLTVFAIVSTVSSKSFAQPIGAKYEMTPENGTSISFLPGFVSSLSVTLLSELGDKTFLIAAILAMKNARLTVFLGSISALVIMTVISVALGFAANVIPPLYTHYLSIVLFAFFGLKMIYDAYRMKPNEVVEDYNQVEKSLLLKEGENKQSCMDNSILSGVFWQALSMTFLAEWGDRSQISTILLAARNNIYGVTLGTILGHTICTSLAVIAGRLIAHKISVKTVTYIGGLVFIGCAIFELVSGLLSVDDVIIE